jgi:hypothetical protein
MLGFALPCASQLACGGRAVIDVDPQDGAPGASSVGTGSGVGGAVGAGSGATSGTGGSGAWEAIECSNPRWVEPAVYVDAPATAERVALLPIGNADAGRWALAWDEPGQALLAGAIHSALLEDWTAWPPTLSQTGPNFPLVEGASHALARGDASDFAFAARAPSFELSLGYAEPGENGSTFVTAVGFGEVLDLAHAPFGAYLLATGGPALTLSRFAGLSPGLVPDDELTLCIDGTIRAATVHSGDGGFLVAHNAAANASVCQGQPSGPPVRVDVARVTPSGSFEDGDVFAADGSFYYGGEVDDLSLVPDPQGAILSFPPVENPNGQSIHSVIQLDRGGRQLARVHLVTEGFFEHAFASWPLGFAYAYVDTSTAQPSLQVHFSDWIGVSAAPSQPAPADGYQGRPAIALAPDGRAALVAVRIRASDGVQRIALRKVECSVF